MKVKLEIDGVNSRKKFEHDGPSVRIGRAPLCELPLNDASYQGISWIHANIELSPDGAFLKDLESSNGTFLNDRRVAQRVMVKVGDYVRLGRSGPILRIQVLDITPAAAAVVPAISASPGMRRAAVREYQAVEAPKTCPKAANYRSTTRRLVDAMHVRQRATGVLGAISAIVILFVILGVYVVHRSHIEAVSQQTDSLAEQTSRGALAFREDLSQVKQRVDEMSAADAASIYKKFNDAVYFVKWDGGYATAFAIDRSGVFATNAHVAQPVHESLQKGKRASLLSQGGSREYVITSAKWHSLYQDGGRSNTPDVGVLHVRISPGEVVPTVVDLASIEDLRQLEVGAPVCYIGFPFFLATDYGSLPKISARVYQGRLNRLLSLSEEASDFDNQRLLEHDMFSWGGASGSPIFDKRGKVVALHFAGNLIEGKRGPAGPKWGMRVDLLREVIKAP